MYSKMNNAIYFSIYIQNLQKHNATQYAEKNIRISHMENNSRTNEKHESEKGVCKCCKKQLIVSNMNRQNLCNSCYIDLHLLSIM